MSFAKRPETAPIHELQVMLRKISPESGLAVDGIFGPETEKALRCFQKEQGLEETGAADLETWEALRGAYGLAKVMIDPAEGLYLPLRPHQKLEQGCTNLHLYLVQAMLTAMRRLVCDLPPLTISGRLDAQTQKALRWFQHQSALEETGEVDRNTWRHLVHSYRSTVGDGSGAFPYYPSERTFEPPIRTEAEQI